MENHNMENNNIENNDIKEPKVYISKTGTVYHITPGGHLAKPYKKKDSPGKRGRRGFDTEAERKAHLTLNTLKCNLKSIDVSLLSESEQRGLMMLTLQMCSKLSIIVNV